MEENDRNRNEPEEPDSVEGSGAETAEGSNEFGLDPAQELATNLDPNLQDVILSLKSGKSPDPSLIQESQEGDLTIEVLAVLRDPQKPVEGLKILRVIGDVVTGTVAPDKIEAVSYDPNVKSLKAATRIDPNLHISIPEIRAAQEAIRDSLSPGASRIDGWGVIVGIIDF